jgi:hypothetical protein
MHDESGEIAPDDSAAGSFAPERMDIAVPEGWTVEKMDGRQGYVLKPPAGQERQMLDALLSQSDQALNRIVYQARRVQSGESSTEDGRPALARTIDVRISGIRLVLPQDDASNTVAIERTVSFEAPLIPVISAEQ